MNILIWKLSYLPCAVLGLALSMTFRAQAETTVCTEIASVPTRIVKAGVYCLKHDLTSNAVGAEESSEGAAITIAADHVTIDFNDHTLQHAGDLETLLSQGQGSIGIFAENRHHITLLNGLIRGFVSAIWLHDTGVNISGSHRLESLLLEGNGSIVTYLNGDNNEVHGNRLLNNDITYRRGNYGVVTIGANQTIIDNTISNLVRLPEAGETMAIYTSGASTIRGNRITGIYTDDFSMSYAIKSSDPNSVIEDNVILNSGKPGAGAAAIQAGICHKNKMLSYEPTLTICKDAGGNAAF